MGHSFPPPLKKRFFPLVEDIYPEPDTFIPESIPTWTEQSLRLDAAERQREQKAKRKAYHQSWASQNKARKMAIEQRRRARKSGNGGFFTAEEWADLCARYGNVCLCCGAANTLTADHVIPLSKGGTSNIENIQPLCRSCNSRKSTNTVDYRK